MSEELRVGTSALPDTDTTSRGLGLPGGADPSSACSRPSSSLPCPSLPCPQPPKGGPCAAGGQSQQPAGGPSCHSGTLQAGVKGRGQHTPPNSPLLVRPAQQSLRCTCRSSAQAEGGHKTTHTGATPERWLDTCHVSPQPHTPLPLHLDSPRAGSLPPAV